MNAKLILATGSHAGIEAPLKHGYYMIGRDDECQIKPKSHSVSRRHCLLLCAPDGIRAFDLASANGTRVNEQLLEPSQWALLSDGDQLRCGKVAFDVAIENDLACDVTADPSSEPSGIKSAPAIVQGNAWEDFDIASFLEAEDDAEREKRYASLKAHAKRRKPGDVRSVQTKPPSQSCEVTSLDLVQGDQQAQAVLKEAREQARNKAAGNTDSDSQLSARARRLAAIRAKIEADRRDADLKKAIQRSLSGHAEIIEHPLPAASAQTKPLATVRSPANKARQQSSSMLKLCGAILMATVFGAFFLYSTVNTVPGQPARVIDGID